MHVAFSFLSSFYSASFRLVLPLAPATCRLLSLPWRGFCPILAVHVACSDYASIPLLSLELVC